MTHLSLTSCNWVADRVAQLRQEFPEVFSEGKIDFERLRSALGEFAVEARELYGLTWAGKSEAIRNIQMPSHGTLLPMPEESVNFDSTENLIIEGDNLEVLKLLQKSYYSKVKMIYIDPPYNTGREFIYPDNYQEGLHEYLRFSGQVNEEGIKLSTNTETSGRFHSKWLTMMYPRLFLARNLLSDDGVIFVSIDKHEVKNLHYLLDEIFGEENQISLLTWEKGRKNDSTFYSDSVEYVLIYAKNRELLARRGGWRMKKPGLELVLAHYQKLRSQQLSHAEIEQEMREFYRSLPEEESARELKHFFRSDERGLFFGGDISSASTSIPDYDVIHPETGRPVRKPSRGWGCTPRVMEQLISENRVLFGSDETTIPLKKVYLEESDTVVATPVIYKDGRAATQTLKLLFGEVVFNNPKDHEVISEFIEYIGASDAIILDFFAGSGTTAHSVLDLNRRDAGRRKFILVQLPEPTGRADFETISKITIERVRRVIDQIKEKEPTCASLESQDLGFRVFRLATSNFKIWELQHASSSSVDLAQQLEFFANNIQADRSQQDVLFEILLKSGLPLTVSIDSIQVCGQTVFSVGGGAFLICLEERVFAETLREMIVLRPQHVVCKDAAFHGNDNLKTNVKLEMESHGISFRTV